MIPHALHLKSARSTAATSSRSPGRWLIASLIGAVAVILLLLAFKPANTRHLWIAPHSTGELQSLPVHRGVLDVESPAVP